MCVIVVKKPGQEVPPDNILKKCWDENPHGAGFMIQHGNKILIRKGFMTFDSLMESLYALNRDLGYKTLKNKYLVIHFRHASSALVTPEYTHPFPISDKIEDLMSTEVLTDMALAHNGHFSGFGTSRYVRWHAAYHKAESRDESNDLTKPLLSDTQDFIRRVLYPIKRFLRNKGIQNLLQHTINSNRVAILYPTRSGKGKAIVIGHWYEKDGYVFSNLEWLYQSYKSHLYRRSYTYYDHDII